MLRISIAFLYRQTRHIRGEAGSCIYIIFLISMYTPPTCTLLNMFFEFSNVPPLGPTPGFRPKAFYHFLLSLTFVVASSLQTCLDHFFCFNLAFKLGWSRKSIFFAKYEISTKVILISRNFVDISSLEFSEISFIHFCKISWHYFRPTFYKLARSLSFQSSTIRVDTKFRDTKFREISHQKLISYFAK
jgi:hypothetical protein